MLGVLAHGGGQFLHRGGGFFQVGGLLLGTARQVVVAGGDLGGCQVDAGRRTLDTANDAGELVNGGVGIVTHQREHAIELAVHAHREVTLRQRLQHLRHLGKVAISGFHQVVQAAHHVAEVVLVAIQVAALGEVTGSGGSGQARDFGVDRGQAVLDAVHGLGHHRALAGQSVDVRAHVANRVAFQDVQHVQDGVHLRGHQIIGGVDHLPVFAGERALVHAIADGAGVVLAGHFTLGGDHRLHLRLHALHRRQQLADFVAARGVDAAIELADGNIVGHADGFLERHHDRADDRPGKQCRQHQGQRKHTEYREQRAGMCLPGFGGLLLQLCLVVLRELLELVEQVTTQHARFVAGNGAGSLEVILRDGGGNALVGAEVGRAECLHFVV
ncbi:hypothetical protein D3C81_877480 [compost metagenome]